MSLARGRGRSCDCDGIVYLDSVSYAWLGHRQAVAFVPFEYVVSDLDQSASSIM